MTDRTRQPNSFPVVMCPGCKIEMRIVSTEAKSDGLATVTYHCDQCGTETQRTFKSSSKL